MKLFKTNKFKSLLLVGALSLSLFFGGCSSATGTLSTITELIPLRKKMIILCQRDQQRLL